MDMSIEIGILLAYAAGILVLYLVGYLFLVPIKFLFKLFINSLLGGLFIVGVNWIGGFMGFHLALNLFSAITVGILGLPGAVVLWFLTTI